MAAPYDVEALRADFPILAREVHGKPLVYFDNAASAQKPRAVIDAISRAYENEYANVHRGLHELSNATTEKFEAARARIAAFLGADEPDEVVFTRGATEGINLVASAFLEPRIEPGDEIVLSVLEHHSNIVPWHFLRERRGAALKWIDIDDAGVLDMDAYRAALGPRVKMVAMSHMSNALGTINPVAEIVALAHEREIPVLIDGSQAAVHLPLDVAAIGADFYVVTGHKLYGPSGSGAVWARAETWGAMRPWHGGGEMIRDVGRDAVTYAEAPHRFEAGTPPIVPMLGLAAAVDYVDRIGREGVAAHEADLLAYAEARLGELNWVTVYGRAEHKGAILSFNVDGAHAHDVSTVVDRSGVAIRAGHHCAQPLMERLGVAATARASFGLYNTRGEVDALIEALHRCRQLFA